MKPGEYVVVSLSVSGKKRALARVVEYMGLTVRVELYRSKPESVTERVLSLAQVVGSAEDSEALRAFQSVYLMRGAQMRRTRAGMTIGQLARVVGVSPHTVKSAEAGTRKTHARVRLWIVEALRRVEEKRVKGPS